MNQLTFVLTGTLSQPRDYYTELIEECGHKVAKSVTSNTDYLVMGADAGSKLDKANELGITIIDEKRLNDILNDKLEITIYHFYTEEYGENEAMFDDEFNLLGAWHCNDANWRSEYFNPFMRNLGVKVKELPKSKTRYAINVVGKYLGYQRVFN